MLNCVGWCVHNIIMLALHGLVKQTSWNKRDAIDATPIKMPEHTLSCTYSLKNCSRFCFGKPCPGSVEIRFLYPGETIARWPRGGGGGGFHDADEGVFRNTRAIDIVKSLLIHCGWSHPQAPVWSELAAAFQSLSKIKRETMPGASLHHFAGNMVHNGACVIMKIFDRQNVGYCSVDISLKTVSQFCVELAAASEVFVYHHKRIIISVLAIRFIMEPLCVLFSRKHLQISFSWVVFCRLLFCSLFCCNIAMLLSAC